MYFDHIATEFGDNTKHQKLLDIGYLLWHGYDVRADIHHTYSPDHQSVSEHDVRYTICSLLAELWGGYADSVEEMFKYKNMDGLIDELEKAVLRYYHLPNSPYTPHYLKDPLEMEERGILIRGIRLLDSNEKPIKDINPIIGPVKCVNELWDEFSAIAPKVEEYPHLIPRNQPVNKNIKPYKRKITLQKGVNSEHKIVDWCKRLTSEFSKIYKDSNITISEDNATLSALVFDSPYQYRAE